MNRIAIVLLAGLLVGCAPITKYQMPEQALNVALRAGPGDVVVRVSKARDLENAFGRADLYGRKTNEGFSELRFVGLDRDGAVLLYRKDVNIISNETTLSRTPIAQSFSSQNTTVNATASGPFISGNANTFGATTTLLPAQDFHVVVPSDAIPIRLAPGVKSLPFEGQNVVILDTTGTTLSYRITSGP